MRLLILFAGILFLTLGCGPLKKTIAPIVVNPPINEAESSSDFQVYGKVIYEGNKNYLPTRIKEDNTDSNPKFTLKYSYDVHYGSGDTPDHWQYTFAAAGGASLGKDSVLVIGILEIIEGNKVVKTYNATAQTEQTRYLSEESETFTELRQRCLLAVRDNIDLQLQKDQGFYKGN